MCMTLLTVRMGDHRLSQSRTANGRQFTDRVLIWSLVVLDNQCRDLIQVPGEEVEVEGEAVVLEEEALEVLVVAQRFNTPLEAGKTTS